MIRLIVFLVIATVAALVAVWFANNPGAVAITWGGRVVETSVGILVLAFAAVALFVAGLFEIARILGGLPRQVRRNRSEARRIRGYKALSTGLIAAAAGDGGRAQSLLRESERLIPGESSNLLLAAQAAQLQGREEIAHLKFRRMLEAPETELLGLRGLLAQAAKVQDRDEALQLAQRAYRRSPTTPWVVSTLFDLLTRKQRWQEALVLVPELQQLKEIDEATAKRRCGLLEHLIARDDQAAGRTNEALAHAKKALRLAPDMPPVATQASEVALAAGRQRLARKSLEGAWRAQPHPDIARALAQAVPGETPEQTARRLEKRLPSLRRDDVETYVTLAEVDLAAGRLDDARTHLNRVVTPHPSARICRLMAELDRASGAPPARVQEWLTKAAEAPPEPAWIDEDTGEALPAWQPFSASGRFDAVQWGTPNRLTPMVGQDHGPFLTAEVVDPVDPGKPVTMDQPRPAAAA